MESFDLKTPEQLKNELDETAEAMAKISYDYRRLEEHKKIIEAVLTKEYKQSNNRSISEAKIFALSDERYKQHIDGLVHAETEYLKLKSKYANMQSYIKYLITWITTQRDLSK